MKIDFTKLKTYPLRSRKSKVSIKNLCRPFKKNPSFSNFFNALPNILAGQDLKEVVERIVNARKKNRHVLVGMGAHSIKVGLSPLFVQLINRGVITGLAMNGACLIHDFELAFAGKTSEDVDTAITDGSFGMAEETGYYLNEAIKSGAENNTGIGSAVGDMLLKLKPRYLGLSILASARKQGVPVTVHVALGTDIIHFHKNADHQAIGKGTMIDFKNFTELVSELSGGVFINIGSAVIIPEVFLKAITIARNLGHRVDNITTVNLDFVRQYRPLTNVVSRPTKGSGRGFSLTGHHEILVPLIFWSVMERYKR